MTTQQTANHIRPCSAFDLLSCTIALCFRKPQKHEDIFSNATMKEVTSDLLTCISIQVTVNRILIPNVWWITFWKSSPPPAAPPSLRVAMLTQYVLSSGSDEYIIGSLSATRSTQMNTLQQKCSNANIPVHFVNTWIGWKQPTGGTVYVAAPKISSRRLWLSEAGR
jgi:hypothetical protein